MDVFAVLVNDGREYEIDQLIAGSAVDLPRFRVGTGWNGVTMPDETKSSLDTEIAIDFTDITITKLSSTTFKVVCALPFVAGFEDTINEIGVFGGGSNLYLYGVFPDDVKSNSKEITFSLSVQA